MYERVSFHCKCEGNRPGPTSSKCLYKVGPGIFHWEYEAKCMNVCLFIVNVKQIVVVQIHIGFRIKLDQASCIQNMKEHASTSLFSL